MPMVSSRLVKPPDNETVLTRSGAALIFAAYHLGKWFEVPNGGEMSEPEEWLLIPFNELPVPAQAEPPTVCTSEQSVSETVPNNEATENGEAKGASPERECEESLVSDQDSRGGQIFFDFIKGPNADQPL